MTCTDAAYAGGGFADHPNVAAVLLISLGCESLASVEMAEQLKAPASTVNSSACRSPVGLRRPLLAARPSRGRCSMRAACAREPVSLAELTVGVECGGS